jgi:hypothetical protein
MTRGSAYAHAMARRPRPVDYLLIGLLTAVVVAQMALIVRGLPT